MVCCIRYLGSACAAGTVLRPKAALPSPGASRCRNRFFGQRPDGGSHRAAGRVKGSKWGRWPRSLSQLRQEQARPACARPLG